MGSTFSQGLHCVRHGVNINTLDVLQSSLDLAAAKDPYTQARFQNIPSSGQANRSIVGGESDRENNRGSDNTQWKQTLPYIPYQE